MLKIFEVMHKKNDLSTSENYNRDIEHFGIEETFISTESDYLIQRLYQDFFHHVTMIGTFATLKICALFYISYSQWKNLALGCCGNLEGTVTA